MARKHHDLVVWSDAIRLVKEIYRLTASFPDDERYGLVSQLRRSAVSVPSNIAEGAGRASRKEFLRFLGIARGSLSELETQLIIARELRYLDTHESLDTDLENLFAKLGALIQSLQGS